MVISFPFFQHSFFDISLTTQVQISVYVIVGLPKCSVSKLFFHLQIIRMVLTSYCRFQLHFINEKNMHFLLSNIEVKWLYHFLSFSIVFLYSFYNASRNFYAKLVCAQGFTIQVDCRPVVTWLLLQVELNCRNKCTLLPSTLCFAR